MINVLSPRFVKVLLAVGALGFIISHPVLLGWLGAQTPLWAFGLWYFVFFGFISFLGITFFPGKFRLRHAVGIIVLWFAISPILGWVDNPYLSEKITGARLTGVEAGVEETVSTMFWMMFTSDVGILIWLVYVITPVILVTVAFIILKPEPFYNFFYKIVA